MPNAVAGNQLNEHDSYLNSNVVLDDYTINNEHGIEFDLLKLVQSATRHIYKNWKW